MVPKRVLQGVVPAKELPGLQLFNMPVAEDEVPPAPMPSPHGLPVTRGLDFWNRKRIGKSRLLLDGRQVMPLMQKGQAIGVLVQFLGTRTLVDV